MPLWKRIVVWGGLAVVLVVLVALAMAPRPLPVDLATAKRGSLEVTLDEEGVTRVRDRFVVSAPLAGRVLRIELEPGDPVIGGESVLATFQPADPSLLDVRSRSEAEARVKASRAALERARSERARARAESGFAVNELARQRRLADEGIVSAEALDSSELDARTREEAARASDFSVHNLQHELEMAEARLLGAGEPAADGRAGTIEIHSPVDGVVLRRLLESERIVTAGEPLIEVADPSRLEIVADYLSMDAVRIRPGQQVYIEHWGGDGPLHGRVRRVEPYGFTKVSALGVEEQRVNVVIGFDDSREAWATLGDGYRVEVRTVVLARSDVVKIPTSSLFRSGESWGVFVVRDGEAGLREIEIGARGNLEAEVVAGLDAGARVVVHPGDAISDGVRVTPR